MSGPWTWEILELGEKLRGGVFFPIFGATRTWRFNNIPDIYTSLSSTRPLFSSRNLICLACCVREISASKYSTVDSALKISQNAWTFAPFPDNAPRKSQLRTSASRTYSMSARIVFGGGGRCLEQMSDHGLCMDMCVNGCKIRLWRDW